MKTDHGNLPVRSAYRQFSRNKVLSMIEVCAFGLGCFYTPLHHGSLDEKLQYGLRFEIGLCEHCRSGLNEDRILHKLDHLLGHIRVPDQ